MCFAPEMDLIAGVVVTGIGVDALRRVPRRELVPLAALPVVFGTHQLIETLVWLHLRGQVPDCVGQPATWIYLLIAIVIVPVIVPFAFKQMGANRSTAASNAFLAAGCISAGLLFYALMDGNNSARIDGHHIAYSVGTPFLTFTLGLYVFAVCAPGVFSSWPRLRLFGYTNLAVVTSLMLLMQNAVISLWCFWAAISSVLINLHVRRENSSPPSQVRSGRRQRAPGAEDREESRDG